MDAERASLAEQLLEEAVRRSRERQAANVGWARAASEAAGGGAPSNCGLGAHAEVVLDLSEHGRKLFERLFPTPPAEGEVARMHAVMRAWIERQDELDRKRNHFLKAFRHKHGFDRASYDAERLAQFEAGLADVNVEADRERREHGKRLLEAAGG